MRWLLTLITRVSVRFGTTTLRPPTSAEFTMPDHMMREAKAGGWCLTRGHLPAMAVRLLSTKRGKSRASLRAIQRLLAWERMLPKKVTHLILLSDAIGGKLSRPRWLIVSWNALLNHERSHARTMRRTLQWHVEVDAYMWRWFSEEWDDCMIALFSEPGIYRESLTLVDDDPGMAAWQATEEILARLCVMMHAPQDDRSRLFIARRELKRNSGALVALTTRIEKHWDSPEVLVGWLDAICDKP